MSNPSETSSTKLSLENAILAKETLAHLSGQLSCLLCEEAYSEALGHLKAIHNGLDTIITTDIADIIAE